jgi:peptide/nickel transport system permease protein
MTAQSGVAADVPIARRADRGRLRRAAHLLRRDRTALIGFMVLVLVVLAAAFGPIFFPYDPSALALEERLRPPLSCDGAVCHLAGTDQLGRDLMSRLLYGARISLVVGFASVIIGGTIGTLLGLMSGYLGGFFDTIVMRLADAQLAVPTIMLAIAVLAVLGADLKNLILVLGVTAWVVYARIMRASVLSVREREFVTAARAIGGGPVRIMLRHVLPNAFDPIVVIATSQLATLMVAEAALSFLGLGVPPPTPTWGNILADGRTFLATAWWVAALPGLALTITVLSVNLVGDWIRDVLDPKTLRD